MSTNLLNAAPGLDLSEDAVIGQSGHSEAILESESPITQIPSPGVSIDEEPSSILADFLELTKPGIVMMILVTTVATAFVGAGGLVGWISLYWLLVGTGLVAASAGAANQVWERVIDQKMKRTAARPLPAGRMSALPACVFTLMLGFVGTWVLGAQFSAAPALVGLMTWVVYVLIYTPMKTRTAWNTTVGAIAGALPVLIGYTATGGELTGVTGWLLMGVLVAWQYPHFMALAWMYRQQYDEAGFKMTTTVEPSGKSAGWQSLVGSIALVVCAVALCASSELDLFFWIGSVCVIGSTFPMVKASYRFLCDRTDQTARTLFLSSLAVLPAVLLIVTIRVFV